MSKIYRLTWVETFAVLLGAAPFIASYRIPVEVDRECIYTWRALMSRTAVVWSAT